MQMIIKMQVTRKGGYVRITLCFIHIFIIHILRK